MVLASIECTILEGAFPMQPTINSGDTAYVLICSAMVLLMTPALAFFYGGLVRRKNVLNTMMSSYMSIAVASVLWVLVGYSISFAPGGGGVWGSLKWFGLGGVGWGPNTDYAATIPHLAFAAFQMMFAIITPALIAGAIAERMRFPALMIFVALWSVIVYYPLAHMLWGVDGLLHKLGAVDFAGGNVVHISSGVSGLVACMLIGKRKNHGLIKPVPHNIPFVLLGAGLLWFGWFGFNSGSALAANGLAVHAFLTTNTAGACGMLSWMFIEALTNGKPTALGAATGGVIGLAAITQGAGYVPIWAAVIIGLTISPLCWLAISKIKEKFGYDDALDVFGCHGIGGIWGAIATGLFAQQSINPAALKFNGLIFGDVRLIAAQLVSIAVTIVLSIVGTYVILKAIGLVTKIRVTPREESDGLDGSQHGESAYPSFMGLD
jgi:ammonium transporter, Amt family